MELAELGLWVAGMAHASQNESRDLSRLLPPPPPGRVGLAVLHANLAVARDGAAHEPYAPANLQDLLSGPFALWALGHIHIPQELGRHPRVLYAGTPQGAHLGEGGPRGAWLLELEAGSLNAEFTPLAPLMFHDLVLDDLMRLESPAALLAQVREALGALAPASPWPQEHCLRLRLAGPSPLWKALGREEPATVAYGAQEKPGPGRAGAGNERPVPAGRPPGFGRPARCLGPAPWPSSSRPRTTPSCWPPWSGSWPAPCTRTSAACCPPSGGPGWPVCWTRPAGWPLRGLWQGGPENGDAA